ncbi:MAG: phenylalanine--tRNA ligase subunit beta [Actinobacteria bacterium]|nr:MAG: phenylalanine--tRNA ligase subunit beta [Actinomycetota bacterium]
MRVSLNWLKDYIDISGISIEDLAEKLDLSGTEIENVFEEGAGLDTVVVGEIKKIKSHPKADRLTLCEVYTGVETISIVCGAKNIKEKDKVPVALPEARLPNGMVIKSAVIRGEKSAGMLASAVELGLGEDASGIMILDKKFDPGERLDVALDLRDTILELEITPNRPDLMSMKGIAREIGAIFGKDYSVTEAKIKEADKEATELANIKVNDTDLCPRYVGKIITDVVVGQSPAWLKKRLIAAGARPINNLVDITNYVLFETGQPLHAFDYELLKGGKIIVRRAKDKEKITTIDDIERPLTTENLVIADVKGPIALAGVMGGASTEVNDQTKVVLLESAYFNPLNIGYTSRNLGLISESSIRFERGVDPNKASYAADRAAQLMQELASGTVLKGSADVYPEKFKFKKLKMRPKRANAVLGIDLKEKEMSKMLSSLELEVNPKKDELEVGVPTFRPDLEREIDLIEEIGRLYDLNKIKSTLPGVSQVGGATEIDYLQQEIRDQLSAQGLKEALTYAFIETAALKNLPKTEQDAIELLNPLSEEQSALRTLLLPGLLKSLQYNVARNQENVFLFEMGRVFKKIKSASVEKNHLGLILSGNWNSNNWYSVDGAIDFYDVKGLVDSILKKSKVTERLILESSEYKLFNPQRSFKMLLGENKLGFVGEIHPNFAKKNDLQTTAYAELDLDILLKYRQLELPFKGVPPYPGITLDVALLLEASIKHEEVVRSMEEMGHDLLADIMLFDIYKGKGIEKGKKSMAYSLTYQSMERTLELEEVQKIHDEIIKNLQKDLGAKIR